MDGSNGHINVRDKVNHLRIQKQRGQIIIFMMFAIIPLALLAAMIFNGGYLVAQKTKLQNATDTSALMEASWTARSLNIMSMNNTAMTQAQAITSSAWAMEKPLMDAGLTAGLVAGFYLGRAYLVGNSCPPWCYIVSAIVYPGMYTLLNERVLEPLYDLQRQQKNAIHVDGDIDKGFAKAAASFGRMNKILAEKFPDEVEEYSDKLLLANYSEATQMRYVGWADDGSLDRTQLDFPVQDQSLRKAASKVFDEFRNTSNPDTFRDSSIEEKLKRAADSVMDVRDFTDVFFAGQTGTQLNPFDLRSEYSDFRNNPLLIPTFNYFGNFKHQGYAPGTGPFSQGRNNLETEFETVFNELSGFVDGTAIGNEIEKLKERIGGGGALGFLTDFYFDIQIKIVDTIIAPLVATAYKDQSTDPEDFKNRLNQVWEWSTLYGETHYTNRWDLSAEINWGPIPLSAPPRMWRGIIPGLLHGKDPTNIAGIVAEAFEREIDVEALGAGIVDEVNRRESVELERCQRVGLRGAIAALTRQVIQEKEDAPGADPNESIKLTEAEKSEIKRRAELKVKQDCEKEQDGRVKDHDIKEPNGGNTNTGVTTGEREEVEDHQDRYGEGFEGGKPEEPAEMGLEQARKWQKYLEYVNWLFEPAYQAINLPFPADALPLLAILGNRGDDNSEVPCVKTFFEGLLCVHETPTYAVRNQRLYPEIFPDFLSEKLSGISSKLDKLTELTDLLADRKDWSLLVAATAPATLPVAPLGYGDVPTELATMAQAEVYNAQWYDLFTQSWKAKLTPISLFDDEEHLSLIESSWGGVVNFSNLLSIAGEKGQMVLTH